jgi:hypothetical protein
MSIFTKILEKLGLKKDTTSGGAAPASRPMGREMTEAEKAKMRGQNPLAPKAMSEVDVVKKLESMNKDSGLNWKTSIVDLLKVLDIDSSREARNELAKELGCPADLMSDSAKMNTWLHKAVLKKIADNGGNIPRELLD